MYCCKFHITAAGHFDSSKSWSWRFSYKKIKRCLHAFTVGWKWHIYENVSFSVKFKSKVTVLMQLYVVGHSCCPHGGLLMAWSLLLWLHLELYQVHVSLETFGRVLEHYNALCSMIAYGEVISVLCFIFHTIKWILMRFRSGLSSTVGCITSVLRI